LFDVYLKYPQTGPAIPYRRDLGLIKCSDTSCKSGRRKSGRREPERNATPDISPCDFFRFNSLEDKLIDKGYATPQELFCAVETIISGIPSDLISRIFQTWQERLQKCCNLRGNHIVQMLRFA
jgi:hypothetical protein